MEWKAVGQRKRMRLLLWCEPETARACVRTLERRANAVAARQRAHDLEKLKHSVRVYIQDKIRFACGHGTTSAVGWLSSWFGIKVGKGLVLGQTRCELKE